MEEAKVSSRSPHGIGKRVCEILQDLKSLSQDLEKLKTQSKGHADCRSMTIDEMLRLISGFLELLALKDELQSIALSRAIETAGRSMFQSNVTLRAIMSKSLVSPEELQAAVDASIPEEPTEQVAEPAAPEPPVEEEKESRIIVPNFVR